MSMCRVFSCAVGRGCLLWPVHSFGRSLLAFVLLHSVPWGQICLLFQVFLDFLLWVSDAIQTLHPLSLSSPLALSLSQHQELFQWVSSMHHMAKIMELQFQHQSFQWIFRTDFLEDSLVWCPCYPSNSQESSPETQFESISSSVLSLLNGPTLTAIYDHWKNHSFDYMDLCWQSEVCFLKHCLGLL